MNDGIWLASMETPGLVRHKEAPIAPRCSSTDVINVIDSPGLRLDAGIAVSCDTAPYRRLFRWFRPKSLPHAPSRSYSAEKGGTPGASAIINAIIAIAVP